MQESKLEPAVKSLMELIFDEKRMTDAIVEMKYDIKKLPLGKLTTEQIKGLSHTFPFHISRIAAGYEALKDIEKCINVCC